MHGETGSRTGLIALSPLLVRLANRLGIEANALAARIPADTIRRTKFPVLESVDQDGKITYVAPLVMHDGPRSRF